MPYIKTTLTDREIHLITSALQGVIPIRDGGANATLATQVSREYSDLRGLLERFVGDLADEDPRSTPPARVKPFMTGQPLLQFNVYSRGEETPTVFLSDDSDGSPTGFVPVPLSAHSYIRVEEGDDPIIGPEQIHQTVGAQRLIGSSRGFHYDLAAGCDDEECTCQERGYCPNSSGAFFANGTDKAYTAYLPASSPVLEYINTHSRRRCRDEMLADMSGSILPLLSRDEVRDALNINRTQMRYAENPSLLIAHKIMALASIACTASAECLSNANIVATIDVLL